MVTRRIDVITIALNYIQLVSRPVISVNKDGWFPCSPNHYKKAE